MPAHWYFDWTTFCILLSLTLCEGVRRVPAGALLLRNAAGYPWQVAGGPYLAPGWRLASWLSPLVCHVVLSPGAGSGRTPPRHLRRWITLLRVPGAAALVALVIGVPLLTESAGVAGLIQALAAAFGAALITALVSVAALCKMGVEVKRAIRDALPILSPFTAPRAPEIVLSRALEGVAVMEALRALLPADACAEWLRPVAYDVAWGRGGTTQLLQAEEAAAILRRPPSGLFAGDAYCARCGRAYRAAAAGCRACEGVELVRVS